MIHFVLDKLSHGCQELMIPVQRGIRMCTLTVWKFRRLYMQMSLAYLTLGSHAGLEKFYFWLYQKVRLYWLKLLVSCSDIVGNYWTDSPVSMLPIYRELITAGLKIWVFRYPFCIDVTLNNNWRLLDQSSLYIICSGDTDAVVPITATRYSIDALKLATITNWYPWYDHGKVRKTGASSS